MSWKEYERFLDQAKKKPRNVREASGPLIIPTVFSIHLSHWNGTQLIKKYEKIVGSTWMFLRKLDKGNAELYDADFSYVEVSIKGGRTA